MNADLAAFLAGQTPRVEETIVWARGEIRLHVTSYLSDDLPPLSYVTSVRGVVLRQDSVLVVRDSESMHIMPGGRREPGETLRQTLEREVLEETGWMLAAVHLLGFKHFHHLNPQPPDYPYPYPDFLQVVYAARADTYVVGARRTDDYELDASFHPISEAQVMNLTPGERLYLDAALKTFACASLPACQVFHCRI